MAELQQKCSRQCNSFKLQREQETTGTVRERMETTCASQKQLYGSDAERQEVGRYQQDLRTSLELRTADAEVKRMTQAQLIIARSEKIAIIVSTTLPRPH